MIPGSSPPDTRRRASALGRDRESRRLADELREAKGHDETTHSFERLMELVREVLPSVSMVVQPAVW